MGPTTGRVGRLAVVAVAGAVALVGCSSDDGTDPVPPSEASSTTARAEEEAGVDTVEDRTFESNSVEGHELVADTVVRVTFSAGDVAIDAGCNSMGGAYDVAADGTISMPTELRSTMMACDDALMAQDEWVSTWLGDGVTGTVDGDVLTLVGGDVTMALTSMDAGAAGGEEVTPAGAWTLDTIVEGEVASSVPTDVETPTLEIADGTVSVFTGCNSGSGGVEVAADTLVFQPMAITFRACDGPAGELEVTILAVLSGEVPYVTDGETMTTGTDEVSLVWRRA